MNKINTYKTEIRGLKGAPNAQSLEQKIAALIATNSPIEAISPMIYEERGAGVNPGHNIRTDRMEVALDAVDKITKTQIAIREERAQQRAAAQEPKGGITYVTE